MKKVYLASPFFNDIEIERMESVRDILRGKGLNVFVPNEHQNPQYEFGSLDWRKATFKSDMDAVYDCDVMVALIEDGNFSDTGTAYEVAIAYEREIPVILVNRTKETINLMLAESLHALITSDEELKNYDFETLPKVPYLDYVW